LVPFTVRADDAGPLSGVHKIGDHWFVFVDGVMQTGATIVPGEEEGSTFGFPEYVFATDGVIVSVIEGTRPLGSLYSGEVTIPDAETGIEITYLFLPEAQGLRMHRGFHQGRYFHSVYGGMQKQRIVELNVTDRPGARGVSTDVAPALPGDDIAWFYFGPDGVQVTATGWAPEINEDGTVETPFGHIIWGPTGHSSGNPGGGRIFTATQVPGATVEINGKVFGFVEGDLEQVGGCDCEDSDNAAVVHIHVCDDLRPRITLGALAAQDRLIIDFISPMNVAASLAAAVVWIDGVMGLSDAVWMQADGVTAITPAALFAAAQAGEVITSTRLVHSITWPFPGPGSAWTTPETHPVRMNALNPDTGMEFVNISITGAVAVDTTLNPVTVLYTTVEGVDQSQIPIFFGAEDLGLYVVWVETSAGEITMGGTATAPTGGVTGRARDTRPGFMQVATHNAPLGGIRGIEWDDNAHGTGFPGFTPTRTFANHAANLNPLKDAAHGSSYVYVRFSRPVRPDEGTIQISEWLFNGSSATARGELQFTGPFLSCDTGNGIVGNAWSEQRAQRMECLCVLLLHAQPTNTGPGSVAGQLAAGYGCTWYIKLEDSAPNNLIRGNGTYQLDVFGFVATRLDESDMWLYEREGDIRDSFRHEFNATPVPPTEPVGLVVDQIWVSTTPDFLADFVVGRSNLVYSSDRAERVMLVDEILTLLNELDPDDPLAYMVANNYLTVIFSRPVVPGQGTVNLSWNNLIHGTNERWFPVNFADWADIVQSGTTHNFSTMPNWGPGWLEFAETPGTGIDVLGREDITGVTLPGLWEDFGTELSGWTIGGGYTSAANFTHVWYGFNAVQMDFELFRYNNRAHTATPLAATMTPAQAWDPVTVPPITASTRLLDNPPGIGNDALALMAQGVRTLPAMGQEGTRNVILPARLRYTHRPYGLNDLDLTPRPPSTGVGRATLGLGNSWIGTGILPPAGALPNSRRITELELTAAAPWNARTQPTATATADFIRIAIAGFVCAEYWLENFEDYDRDNMVGFFPADVDNENEKILHVQEMFFGVEDDPVPVVMAWGFFDAPRSTFLTGGFLDPTKVQDAIAVGQGNPGGYHFITTADPMGIPPTNIAELIAEGIIAESGPNAPGTLIIWFSEVIAPSAAVPATGMNGGAGTIGGDARIDLSAATAAQAWTHRWYFSRNDEVRPNGGGVTNSGQDTRFPASMVVLDVEDLAASSGLVTINVMQYPELLMFGVGDLAPWHGDIGEHPAPAIRQGRAMGHASLRFVLNPDAIVQGMVDDIMEEGGPVSTVLVEIESNTALMTFLESFDDIDDIDDVIEAVKTLVKSIITGETDVSVLGELQAMLDLMEMRLGHVISRLSADITAGSNAFTEPTSDQLHLFVNHLRHPGGGFMIFEIAEQLLTPLALIYTPMTDLSDLRAWADMSRPAAFGALTGTVTTVQLTAMRDTLFQPMLDALSGGELSDLLGALISALS
jgi:hypothetical protein